jgi:hypothetical protein
MKLILMAFGTSDPVRDSWIIDSMTVIKGFPSKGFKTYFRNKIA